MKLLQNQLQQSKGCCGVSHVLGLLLLVTTCFDNSGFLEVVTLNSLSGVLRWWFSPFVNKSPVSYLFSATFNLAGDLFMLPCLFYVIESN